MGQVNLRELPAAGPSASATPWVAAREADIRPPLVRGVIGSANKPVWMVRLQRWISSSETTVRASPTPTSMVGRIRDEADDVGSDTHRRLSRYQRGTTGKLAVGVDQDIDFVVIEKAMTLGAW